MVVCQEQGANDLHIVQRMPLPPHHFLLQYIPEWFTFPVQVVLEKAVIRIVILNTLEAELFLQQLTGCFYNLSQRALTIHLAHCPPFLPFNVYISKKSI